MATKQSIFDIQGDFRAIRDKIMEAGGECSDETFSSLKAVKLTAEEKFTQCYFIIQQWEAEAQVAKDAEAVAYNHRKRREDSIKNMKAKMVELGCELGITKMDNPHCRFSIQAGRITLSITNIDDLPSDLVDVRMEEVVTPKKDEIEKLLNAGQTVTGAEWKQGDSFIKFLKAKGE